MILDYLKKGGLAALLLAVIALGAATLWTTGTGPARALADHGITTTAFVVQKQRASAGTGAMTVTYAYQSVGTDGDERTHRIGHAVPPSVFDSVRVGQEVEVRYLPEDPAMAEVYPGEHADGRTLLDMTALIAALGAAGLAVAGMGAARRPRMDLQPA
ncbi:DUF3592 domain-containing protein [Rubellimicrobium arenae]|uniref:DUF3592 domain-containing protein n=1 Tax=Rubellimicrobium arenae TaxID=2817372 RepID=UPI001B30F198|nr:DUF3592 domain-containing protein [Rubellimicrobium arenae]